MKLAPLSAPALSLLLLSACAAPQEVKTVEAPSVMGQELSVPEQGLTDFRVQLDVDVKSPNAATVEKAVYELVVEGKPVKSFDQPLTASVPEGGGAVKVSLEGAARYVKDAEELKAISAQGGSLLAALRGKLFVRQSGKLHELDIARSREIRVPRLPTLKLQGVEGARFGPDDVNLNFSIGVVNPNPYPVVMSALDFKIEIAGKTMAEGKRGQGDKVAASSTGVFDFEQPVNKETFGPDVAKQLKSNVVPYRVTAKLTGELFEASLDQPGDVKLNVSK